MFLHFRYLSWTNLSTLTDTRFALIPRYSTISLAVLYSGLFARNNRISNATFPNRFNPSVKCFNFELIIHNPCHNSTISRIKYRYQHPRISRDFAMFMAKHLAGYYLWTVTPVNLRYLSSFRKFKPLFARPYSFVQYIALLPFSWFYYIIFYIIYRL